MLHVTALSQGRTFKTITIILYCTAVDAVLGPHSSVRLFADDTIIYITLTVENDCEIFQEDVQALEKWEADWLMEFHSDKCSVIRVSRKKTIHTYPYTLHGQIFAEETHTKYLRLQ